MPFAAHDKRLIFPDLNSLIITARYKVPVLSSDKIITKLKNTFEANWAPPNVVGETVAFYYMYLSPSEQQEYLASLADPQKFWDVTGKFMEKTLKTLRKGVPIEFRLLVEQHLPDGLIVKIECIPTMYHLICRKGVRKFHEQDIQEAQIECVRFTERIAKGVLGGQEITPPTVGPFIKRTEIKSKLLSLGLVKAVEALDIAEQHVLQNKFPDVLARCREALEKACSWVLGKCGLEETDSFAHNLDRLKSKGFLDGDTVEMLKKCYSYLARVGTPHEKGVEPGLLEAHLSLNVTLTILDYLTSRFG